MANNNENFMIGALIGSLVGAAAVLLLTPISGARARNKILNGFPHAEAEPHHKAPARKRAVSHPVKAAAHTHPKKKH